MFLSSVEFIISHTISINGIIVENRGNGKINTKEKIGVRKNGEAVLKPSWIECGQGRIDRIKT